MDPGPFKRKNFNIIVVPRHDILRKGKKLERMKNVVVTELAPNLIEGSRGKGQESEERPCIGVLFGGDNPHYHFSETLARKVAEGVKIVSQKINCSYYVTTSRRTPDNAEDILEKILENDPRSEGFVSGKNDTDPSTVQKILDRSNMVLVSGESISMVSEAVSSGRKVLVFMPVKKNAKRTKFEDFTINLEKQGYIKVVNPEDISEEIEHSLGESAGTVLPDDNERIYGRIHKLF